MKSSKRRYGLSLALTALVAFSVPVLSQPAAAESPQAVIVGGLGGEASEIAQINEIAQGLSISVAEARSRFSGQNEFVAAVSAAIAAYPDAFYSSEWLPSKNDSEGYKSWVSFTPTVDQKVLELFSGLPYPVEVRFDARVSAQEAESLREKVMARIFKEAPEIIGLTGDLAADGSLSIEYETKDLKSSAASRVIGSILASIPGGLPMPVTAQHGYGIAPQLEVVRGGRTFGSCTLGFVATRGGSQRGGVTAAHCSNASQTPPGSSTSMPFVIEHFGAYGDAQFHSTTDTIDPVVVAGTSGWVNITGVAYPSNGMAVCNYGQTRTGASCTTIRNWNHAFYSGGTYLSRMAQSNASFTNGGDSGGPWWSSGRAIGIHYGKSGGYSTMSRVPDVQSILSVQIAHS